MLLVYSIMNGLQYITWPFELNPICNPRKLQA
jgi:hypothetical protein